MSLILLAQCKECRAIVGEMLGWEGDVPTGGRIIALPTQYVHAEPNTIEFSCRVCKAVLGEQIAGGSFVIKTSSRLFLYNVKSLEFYVVGSASAKTDLITPNQELSPQRAQQSSTQQDITALQQRLEALENVILLMQGGNSNDNDENDEDEDGSSERDLADSMLE